MKEKKNFDFLLYGENSFLNKGCEAIVNTTIKKIRKISDGQIILSTKDKNDMNSYNEIINKYVKAWYSENELQEEEKKKIEYYKTIPFDYMNYETIYEKDCIREIDNADICLSIGGDNYCYGEPNWMFALNRHIAYKNKKNVLYGASLFEKIESPEMIRDLKLYDILVVRETLTYNALSKFIDQDRLMLIPDTAFSLEKKKIELPKIFENESKVVGLNISPLISKYTDDSNNILESVKELINYILKNTDYKIALIPHVYIEGNNDLESLKEIKNLYKEEERIALLDEKIYDCEELKYIISKCKLLVAARTHASIAGYSSIVPTLVIGYSVKSKGIALDLFGEYENYVIPVDTIKPDILIEKFEFIKNNESKIRDILNKKMPEYKEKADEMIEDIIEKLDELDKKYVTNKSKCTGCMACYNICPVNAIEMKESDEGFLYPEINKEKCTNCGKCRKICPANNSCENNKKICECYAVSNKNDDIRANSSSGGLVYEIAKNILDNNGIVYGVTLEENKTKNIRIDSEKDLYKIMGSKYVQSDMQNIMKDVKKDLEEKKKVLFTGTPCQIEGLKKFLEKEYENLVCVSIICHGVPSPKVFREYIKEKENNDKNKISEIHFRDKNWGWHNFNMKYVCENGEKELVPFTEDIYMKGFLKDYYLRESCYNCQMKYGKKSTADVIIGDFWGVETIYPEIDDNKGISAVIVNTEKGRKVFEDINKENINCKNINLEDITKANPALIKSAKYPKEREEFFELIKDNKVSISIRAINEGILSKEVKEKENRIAELEEEWKNIKKWTDELVEAKEYFLKQIENKNKERELLKQENENLKRELNRGYKATIKRYAKKIIYKIKKH